MSERRGGGMGGMRGGMPGKGQVFDRKPINKKATLLRLYISRIFFYEFI